MSWWSRRRDAERESILHEVLTLKPVETRLARFRPPGDRWLYLCDDWRRHELSWSDAEALDALSRSAEGQLVPVTRTLYLFDRRVYEGSRPLNADERLRAVSMIVPSPFLPIVQIEDESLIDRIRNITRQQEMWPARPRQLHEAEPELPSAERRVRRPIPGDVKLFVWQRDRGRCVYCGDNRNLEYDHIIPWADGGADTARNLQLLCQTCNRRKGRSVV